MSYATKQDYIDRYGIEELAQLTDRQDPGSGLVDDDPVTAALADADAEINSYLAVKMATPVSPVPRILIGRAAAIARYLLWKDRASERVRTDYADALTWLAKVSRGEISLGDNVGATTPASAGAPQMVAPERVFDSCRLKDY